MLCAPDPAPGMTSLGITHLAVSLLSFLSFLLLIGLLYKATVMVASIDYKSC